MNTNERHLPGCTDALVCGVDACSTAGNFVLCNDEIKEDPTWRDNTIFVGFNCGFGNWTETKRVDCECRPRETFTSMGTVRLL